MSQNIYGLTDYSNEVMVCVIRRKFLLEADTNPHLYDPIDVQRCRYEDWQIERFLIEKGTQEEALKVLIKAMQWKKTFGVHQRDHKYFPREMPQIFGHEKPSRDREGRQCLWSASRNYQKIPEFDELVRQYTAFFFEKMDRQVGNKGFITISDAKGVSYSNMDMSLTNFSKEVLEYYPQVMKIGCSVDIPWLMMSLFKLTKSFLPKNMRDKIVLVKREQLSEILDIDSDELPVSYGGNRETVYEMSDDMLPLCQSKHLDFTDKQIDNFYKVYKFDKLQ